MEVNGRVNYPIKTVLIRMMENQEFSLDSDLHKFCVSWITIKTAAAGVELFVSSWNEHPIPGAYVTMAIHTTTCNNYVNW